MDSNFQLGKLKTPQQFKTQDSTNLQNYRIDRQAVTAKDVFCPNRKWHPKTRTILTITIKANNSNSMETTKVHQIV